MIPLKSAVILGALGGAHVDLFHGVLRHDLGVVGSFFGVGTPESSRLVSATVEFGDEPVNDAVIADVCRDKWRFYALSIRQAQWLCLSGSGLEA